MKEEENQYPLEEQAAKGTVDELKLALLVYVKLKQHVACFLLLVKKISGLYNESQGKF